MRKTAFIILALLAIFCISNPVKSNAQSTPLPADLLFVTGNSLDWQNKLISIDATTLEARTFYVDNDASYIRPISWSPDGKLLVFLRKFFDPNIPVLNGVRQLGSELCLLDRAGILQTCFAERPSEFIDNNFVVTWSGDSQRVYFVSEMPTAAIWGTYRLIEADIATGQTQQVLFEYPHPENKLPSNFTWSTDLSFVITGVDAWAVERTGFDMPPTLINQTTEEQIDLNSIVPEHSQLNTVCSWLSPQGTYITVNATYIPADYAPDSDVELLGPNLNLTMVYEYQAGTPIILGEPDGINTIQVLGCPTWTNDEQIFFFIGINVQTGIQSIYRYSVGDQSQTIHYQPASFLLLETSLVLSPDETYLAFQTTSIDNHPQIGVLSPPGDIFIISDLYEFALYPIWVPPLSDE